MTGFGVDENQLDARRRRLVFRAWHRGIREMDLIFGHYVNAHIVGMSDETVSKLEYILSFDDRDLLRWITGEISPPCEIDGSFFRDIINHHICINLN
ncbi:FAD assembly factor SdhE [Bartonella machadoae]|uniref:FAD assembly factor SdhE n=1 Tax=Bartonella machadoae TaxID=2893471 RepID=UPI001F4D0F19|nr:succinate dehydrogenase assembly factor 2 [Bartonella machadoae]UNE53447.1 succinate dehydrogenase assembly factor 2 [Bartonella machadoae]